MFRKIALVCFFAMPLWAIDVSTSISQISNEGLYQLLGSFTLRFNGNDFPNASPQHPQYIRVSLSASRGWSQTLVDERLESGPYNAPIRLALYPSQLGELNPLLDPDAVQLVRLVKGETALWLRINQPSSIWAQVNGSIAAPSPSQVINLSVGINAEQSLQSQANTASLGNERADSGELADTRLRADYADTPNFGVGDHEMIDLIAFDSDTQGVENGLPQSGSDLGVTFSNDPKIAVAGNIVPCFDLHLDPLVYEAPPHHLSFSRMNRVALSEWRRELPTIYLSNTSDFGWTVGTKLYLGDQRGTEGPQVRLVQSEVIATGADGIWQVRYTNGQGLYSWEFTLLSGSFPVNGRLDISGLVFAIPCVPSHGLTLTAFASYRDEASVQQDLGPISRRAALLTYSDEGLQSRVFPLISAGISARGIDASSLIPGLRIHNPGESKRQFALFAYNLNGHLIATIPVQDLPAHATFGADSHLIQLIAANSWWEVLADGELLCSSYLADGEQTRLDLQNGIQPTSSQLYGIHLPTHVEAWKTSAHFVSADLESLPRYQLIFPDGHSSNVPNMIFPGSMAVIQDAFFGSDQGRATHFSIVGEAPTGAGLLLIATVTPAMQIASLPMDLVPAQSWRFQHLGAPVSGWWNGLILTNPGDQDAIVTLQLQDAHGALLSQAEVSLVAHSRLAKLLEEFVANREGASSLSISSDQAILAGLMLGQLGKDVLTLVTPAASSSKRWLMPALLDPDLYWSAFTLANPNAFSNRVKLTTRDASGLVLEQLQFELQGMEKRKFLLSEWVSQLAQVQSVEISGTRTLELFALTGSSRSLGTLPIFPRP